MKNEIQPIWCPGKVQECGITGPGIILQPVHQWFPRFDRVSVNVASERKAVAVGIDHDRLIPPAKQRTVAALQLVKTLGVYPIDMPHRTAEIALQGMDQKMVMIPHQAIGMQQNAESLMCFRKGIEKCSAAIRIEKCFLSGQAAIHHVVPGTGVIEAK